MPKLPNDSSETRDQSFINIHKEELTFIALTIASATILKTKGFSCALRLYPSGGAGFNLYKYCDKKSKPLRRFALDYHPFWNKADKTSTYKLHYHRGETYNQIKKHRPYQGGW